MRGVETCTDRQEVQRAAFYVALAIAVVVQVIYWALPSWGRAGLLIMLAALAVAIVAPRFINVEPIIGPEATATLRDFTEGGWATLNRAVEWLQGMLAMV